MDKKDFLINLQSLLQRDEPCNENDVLEDYYEWDSLAKMSVVAFYGTDFNINLEYKDFENLKTVSDLIKLAGENIKG